MYVVQLVIYIPYMYMYLLIHVQCTCGWSYFDKQQDQLLSVYVLHQILLLFICHYCAFMYMYMYMRDSTYTQYIVTGSCIAV